jgi:hypothetical protein
MSVNDHRMKSADNAFQIEPSFARNRHILKWWTKRHDDLIKNHIDEEQWVWYWGITDSIVSKTSTKILDEWKNSDPLCNKFAWYNILMYFAAARAENLGLTKQIRKPEWKNCPLCGDGFVEDSIPYPLIKRFGVDHLDYCEPCLRETIYQDSGGSDLSKAEIIQYLKDLTITLTRVPTQGFGEGIQDFRFLSRDQRLDVLKVLKYKPTTKRVKELFGSWLNALIEAEILEDGTRRTARGIQTIAQDGHVCLSLGEKTIDDFLFYHGISHDREPRYPEGNYRADFLIDSTFIEYFGLKGDPEYDTKTNLKQRICKKHHIRLISIYPSDLISLERLKRKLTPILINHKQDDG